MEYEIVNLKQKTLVGLSARTSNDSLDMGNVIGGLWENFYTGGIHEQIKNRVNEFAIGLYSDYTEDKKGYCITVGNEVSNVDENNKDLDVKIIPAGKYAKFSICGNMVTAVAEAWQQIWDMDLDRSFTGDFEEYKNSEVENAEIDIYVALK
ncbi:GyrI-like domain-containing protein [Intestinibacter bartlettii]|uniref:GyrI-like domain-containing protein n=1 Tax=Intestinibacter bartlettii TaxID=261299 RepID=UPI0039931884